MNARFDGSRRTPLNRLQLVGRINADHPLLGAAQWVHERLTS